MSKLAINENDSFELTKKIASIFGIDVEKEHIHKIQITITADSFYTVVVEKYISFEKYEELVTEISKYKLTKIPEKEA
jgi:hypothetical protein